MSKLKDKNLQSLKKMYVLTSLIFLAVAPTSILVQSCSPSINKCPPYAGREISEFSSDTTAIKTRSKVIYQRVWTTKPFKVGPSVHMLNNTQLIRNQNGLKLQYNPRTE